MKGLSLQGRSFSDLKVEIVLLLILCISMALELYARACGFNFTSDSYQYLSAAKSFSEQGIFLSPDGTYYTYWQPLFPILLSITTKPLVLLGWMNLLSKVILGITFLALAHNFFKTFSFKIIFLVASLCNVSLIMISAFVWSDLIFMTLMYVVLYLALNLQRKNYFILLMIAGFLLCIQRNAGLFWMSGICLWLLSDSKKPFKKNMLKAALVFIVSTSGLWIWNVYNTFLLPANFNFYKHPFFQDWFYNWRLIGETHSKLFVPFEHWLIAVVGIALVGYILMKRFDSRLVLIVCLVGVYAAGYASMVKLDHYEMERYFSGAFPLVYLLVFLAIEKVAEQSSRWVCFGIILLTCAWLIYPSFRTIKNVQFWHDRSCLTESSI